MARMRFAALALPFALEIHDAAGQAQSAFGSLVYPHTVASSGLGEQAVASRNPFDAMQYNPATLVYGRGAGITYYQNPWNLINWVGGLPISSANAYAAIDGIGSFALEYTLWNMGEFSFATPENPDGGEKFLFYQRSIAAGYARHSGSPS